MSGDEVISAVERRFGLRFQPGLRSLIADSARELVSSGVARHLAEVAARVAASAEDDPVVQHMRAAASVCETYFFRAPEQLRSLRDLVITRVLPQKQERSLRIWSAGCATGEEAYTLAALFKDAVPRLEVVGTDMNEVALQAAAAGRFRRRSFRRAAPAEHARWFEEKDGGIEVSGELRRLVSFARFNIATDPLPPALCGFDVVVCRNVLIYLRPDLVPHAAATLAAAAGSPAVLALGSAEYGAAKHAEGFEAARSALFVRGTGPVRRVRRAPAQHVRPVAAQPVPAVREAPPPPPAIEPRPAAARAPPPAPVLVVVPPPEDTCSRARAAADAGDYAAAEQALLETIRAHPTAALAYHLLGSVHAARGALDQAIEELQRATFLDPHLAAAQLALGQALARAGRTVEARRHLRGALRAISSQLDHELVPEMGVTARSARRIAGDALRQLGERA